MGLLACEGDSTGPDDDLLVALAEQAAGDADDDVQHMRSPGIPGLGFPESLGALPGTPDCPSQGGVFVCTREGLHGETVTREISFLDAEGAIQGGYDEATTASANFVSTLLGELANQRGTFDIDRIVDLTVSGLVGDEDTRTWNGFSEGTSSRNFEGGPFAGEVLVRSSSSMIDDVVIAHPRGDDSFPLSGTIATELRVDGGRHEGTHAAVVTFDGTQFATVTIDGETVTVDLTNRRGFRGRRGPGPQGG